MLQFPGLRINTSREDVVLLQFLPQDAQTLFDLIDRNRAHLSQNGDQTAANYPDYESVRLSIDMPKNPKRLRMGIWTDDTLTGTINMTPGKTYGSHEIGYWVGGEFCGEGLATLATKAMIEYARSIGLWQVYASARMENTASQTVLQKAGLSYIGRDLGLYYYGLKLKEKPS